MITISPNQNNSKEYQKYTYIMRNYLTQIEGRQEQALREHRGILKAIIERDKEMAIKLSCQHSESSKNALLNKINLKDDSKS